MRGIKKCLAGIMAAAMLIQPANPQMVFAAADLDEIYNATDLQEPKANPEENPEEDSDKDSEKTPVVETKPEAEPEVDPEAEPAAEPEEPAAEPEAEFEILAEDMDVLEEDEEKEFVRTWPKVEGMGEILYVPDLDDLSEFDTYNGPNAATFSAEDGVARIDGGNGNKAISKRQDFTNFAFEADVTVEKQASMGDQSSAQGGILFRASRGEGNQADGYYGYYLCLNAKGQTLTLGRSSGNNWHEIASKNLPVEYGKTYHLTVTCYGSHINCYVDYNGKNYAKLYIKDSTHTSGGIGMRNWISHTRYENLVVSEFEEESVGADSYTNPILPSCADPDILYEDGTYYLYPTSAGDDDKGIKVYTSTDLVHWTDQGLAFAKNDGWGTGDFWAPDLIKKDDSYYMYYVANEQICVATSDSPLGPFTQEVKEPMDASEKNIDAHIFYDSASDKYYIYYVRFTGGNVIWGAELSDDMMSIKKDTLTQIVNANQGWDQDMGNINEGPFMLTYEGKYYLTYSGAHFQSINYGSAFAVSDSPLGNFKKYEGNPIMKSNSTVHGTGHHCITYSPDGSEMFMVYHCHNNLSQTEPRRLCIDRIHFTKDADGNVILEAKGPTITAQSLPSGAVDVANFIEAGQLPEVKVADNASAAEIEAALPASITVKTSKGDKTAEVTWNAKNVKNSDDEADVEGRIVLGDDIKNLGNKSLVVKAHIIIGNKLVEKKINQVLDSIQIPSADSIKGNIYLPEELDEVVLKWKSNKPLVISDKAVPQDDYYDIPAGVVNRQRKDTKVTLTVTGTYENVSVSRKIKVTVAKALKDEDDYVGYLYAHFREFPGVKGNQDIFYGISKDGLNWTALNNNEAVLKSSVGDKATRDPYIIRSAEGDRFFLLATDQDIYKYGDAVAWDKLSTQGSTCLTIFESTDLIHWTNERCVDVAGSIGGGCAWAPEAIYDENTGEYLVYWASKIAADNYSRQYTFVSRTRDFYTFSEPELFNNFGSNIDTSILAGEDGQYYRLTKIESDMHVRLDMATDYLRAYGDDVSTVKVGDLTFNMVGGNYTYVENTADSCLETFRGNYEGGTMFKFNDRDQWCVMLDEYGGQTRGYIPFVTSDPAEPNSIRALDEQDYVMTEGCKHGVIIPLTAKEYDALVAEYGVAAGKFASLDQEEDPIVAFDFEKAAGDEIIPEAGQEYKLSLSEGAEVKKTSEDNKALYLDGKKGAVASFAQGLFDGAENMSISMDLTPGSAAGFMSALTLAGDASHFAQVAVGSDSLRAYVSARGANKGLGVSTGYPGTRDSNIHLDVTLHDHILTLYVNGICIGSQKVRNISELGSQLALSLGQSVAGSNYYTGYIDNLKIYNRVLTKEELNAKEMTSVAEKIEAETGVLTGKARTATNGAASGGVKVGYIDDMDSTVTLKLNVPEAGTYAIDVAADGDRNAFPNSSHRYWINGDEANAQIINYDKSSNWDVWSLYRIEVALNEGENTITFSHSGRDNSFSELDYIMLHLLEEPEFSLYADGQPMENFDAAKEICQVRVDDLDALPEISVEYAEGTDKSFVAQIVQGSKDRPEAYVKLTCTKDLNYMKSYTIRFVGPDSFESHLVNYGADPFVTYQNGYYYYIFMDRSNKGIYITKSAELDRIGQVEPVCVYMPSGDEPSAELWAPELHFIQGKWYIYYTAGAGSAHRMYALEAKTEDAQGEYTFMGKMSPATDRWAIDQTVLEVGGNLYAIWSGWDGFVDGEQRLYIAKMENPWTISGDRVELSRPEYAWEINERPTINEGPQIAVSPTGVASIVYSASGSWSDTYCLGCLTLRAGADPMEASSWSKAAEPIFEKNDNTTFSTGHACFVGSPDGKEDYLVFHATRFAGGGWNGRGVRIQQAYWNEDGSPFMGPSAEFTDLVNAPTGTKQTDYDRYEAEDAILTGVSPTTTYNSSNNACLYKLVDKNTKAEFTVEAPASGKYRLYLGASTGNNDAALLVQVNDETFEKAVYNFNAAAGNQLCVDNWFGYELDVDLIEGANTILVSGVGNKAEAALDYIEIANLEEATSPNPEPVEPEEPAIDITTEQEFAMQEGEIRRIYPMNSLEVNPQIKWSSSRSRYVSVEKGLVKALRATSKPVTITASLDGEIIREFTVTVEKNVTIDSKNVRTYSDFLTYVDAPDTVEIAAGETASVRVRGGLLATGGKVTFTDCDGDIASTTAGGRPGYYQITAGEETGVHYVLWTVRARGIFGIPFKASGLTRVVVTNPLKAEDLVLLANGQEMEETEEGFVIELKKNDSCKITASLPYGCTDSGNVSLRSSNRNVSVDRYGKITGLKSGKSSKVTVRVGNVTKTITVKVSK
ncbi:MAG: family 43 glycosylhydrolase [Pseudobutyrivibrio sp.]|nr:family 43 glycosylhydrolase [Pseudobutyrivibrio sp.]